MNEIIDWLVGLMEIIGAPGAGIAIFVENVFPPIPSEVVLPLAGFAAARGSMSLVAALVWTTAGSVAGALLLYGIGAWIGRDRIRRIIDRMPLVDVEDYDKTEAWFIRHGTKAIFFGRMVPIFRSLISLPAGVTKMSIPVFVLLTTAGSAIWNSIFVLAGFYLGENWHIIERYADIFQKVIIVAVVVGLAYWIYTKVKKRRRRSAQSDSDVAARAASVDPPADS